MQVRNTLSLIGAVVVALSLSACAGRSPQPVAVVQAKDVTMDCAAIQAEIMQNTSASTDLGKEKGAKVAQNIAAGVAGIFFPPLWAAMDVQGSADTEQKALEARNAYLSQKALSACKDQPMRTTSAK